ncbi:MAG: ChaN family lipoprotein [Bacteroidia bacterium]
MSFAMKGDNKPAYILFDGKGKKTTYSALLAKAKEADIILFGEYHNNPICHWLQYELTKDVHAFKKENLVLGAEMFEADNQQALNNYLAGKIEKKALKDSVRLWPNYKTDYEPLVEFAKTNKLAFIACNVPRKYANLVYMKGTEALDTLSAREKAWLCPLPFKYDPELKCYKDIFESAGGHGGQNLPKSQALKDATMAHFIMANWAPGKTFIHYNGAYHSDYHQSINWYINQQKPGLKVLVISTTEQEKMDALNKEDYDRGDFIICTPASMTKTH